MTTVQPAGNSANDALSGLLGAWRGSTLLAAGRWGPERTVDAEVIYRRVAGGLAVVQSYRHREADGTRHESRGIFTADPDHQDVLWYRPDSTGQPPPAPTRCTWQGGVLRFIRADGAGAVRHTVSVKGDVLTDVAELRNGGSAVPADEGTASGQADDGEYRPFMSSSYRRVSGPDTVMLPGRALQ